MKGRYILYSDAEMAWLEENKALVIGDYHAEFVKEFGRDDVTAANLHALRKRRSWKTGRTGCFSKGQEPFNKGKKCSPGKGGRHPNAQRTQFKSGQLPHNTKFLGHERVSKDGYVEISVDEQNPHTGYERRYALKHLHLWEKLNGSVPDGHCLKCLDGDRLNTDPTNWIAVPRGVLPRLNGGRATRVMAYDTAPEELKPVLMTMARLDQKASELGRRRGGAV
ncbi:HNH endonuclease [Shinella sp. CPCC 101442]|uniref:HNH endonuclease n=1 Tax=Shinella sp. CPCC 101442 TaxID=2932265 RepID=UPI002153110E|nr:HNH endonuclease [Shinella sp. CPCC 101442]MCR6502562.1 HNH endonuclease [Shinella sp. CPCC 101442]